MADYQTYKKIKGTDAILPQTVGPSQATGLSTGVVNKLYFWNCCWWESCNGGCCCLWTVPDRTTTVQFELVSGGGSGPPGRCCTVGHSTPGGSGAYAIKTLYSHTGDFTAGSTQYTICAAGTSRCSENGCCNGRTGCGYCGCESYVQGNGLSNFCAMGGAWGRRKWGEWCYNCNFINQCGLCFNETPACACGRDFFMKGVISQSQDSQYCKNDEHAWSVGSVGPYSAPTGKGREHCASGNVRGCCYGHSIWPGTGGYGPGTQGGDCYGDWGAGGLVVVTYWS